jgi:CheY-like chemotaxis protein
VKADPAQIEQVIMNLAVNARDAMPEGGRLTLSTHNVDLAAGDAEPMLRPGPYVLLTVRDSGCGIDDATLARLFEPFFTTKPAGRGTGLGLATVYGIVKQSGGYIFVDSSPGQGATFRIYLPRMECEDIAGVWESPAVAPEADTGSETILLVEDDDLVRGLARRILAERGYTVLEAHNGIHALSVAETRGDSIQLLVTDVIMPQMSGRELAERLRVLAPELKVLYMSGYTGDALAQQGVLDPDVNLISKPFTPRSLALKVREVLGG